MNCKTNITQSLEFGEWIIHDRGPMPEFLKNQPVKVTNHFGKECKYFANISNYDYDIADPDWSWANINSFALPKEHPYYLALDNENISVEIPEWAKLRAMELLNVHMKYAPDYWGRESDKIHPTVETFAKYIMEHEEAPVYPDLLLAREVLKTTSSYACTDIDGGYFDDTFYMDIVTTAINITKEHYNVGM